MDRVANLLKHRALAKGSGRLTRPSCTVLRVILLTHCPWIVVSLYHFAGVTSILPTGMTFVSWQRPKRSLGGHCEATAGGRRSPNAVHILVLRLRIPTYTRIRSPEGKAWRNTWVNRRSSSVVVSPD